MTAQATRIANPWPAVVLTEVRQVLQLMDADETEIERVGDDADLPGYCAALRAEGRLREAVLFLGHALPRYESLGWAASFIDLLSREDALRPRDRQALDSALRWLGEPCEEFRQAALLASEGTTRNSAEHFVALAVYYSGGTISRPDLEPVGPPPFACNRAATGAVMTACFRGSASNERLQMALDHGEAYAVNGMGAYTAA